MSDLNEWIKERRAIHAEAIEEAARAIWDNDDPEGESPNENFEDEPKWSQERYRQSAAAALEASGASATLPVVLTAIEKVLELHEPIGGFEGDPSYWECNVCGDDRGPKPYPCPTVRAVQSAIKGASDE